MKTCVETSQKQTMDVIFNKQNSQLLTRSFPAEEIIQAKWPKSTCGKSSSYRYSFPTARNAVEYETFCFLFCILVLFSFLESLNVTVCSFMYKVRLHAYESRDRKRLSVCNSPSSNVMKARNTVKNANMKSANFPWFLRKSGLQYECLLFTTKLESNNNI